MATEQIQRPADVTPEPARPPRAAEGGSPRRGPGEQARNWALVIIATAVVLAICYVAKLVIIVLLVSVLLAFVVEPVVGGLQRLKIPRGLGAFVAVTLLLAVLYGATYFFYNQALSFMDEFPKYSQKIRQSLGRVRQQAERLQITTQTVLPESKEDRQTMTVRQQTDWSELLTRSAWSLWDSLLAISFVPFLIYFMLTWQEHARAATVMLFPMEHRNTAYVTLGRISAMIRSFIVGNVLIGVFLGLLSSVVFGVLHLPYFYLVGFISGFLSLVPYLGVILALLPPLAAGFGQVSGGGALVISLTVIGLHLFAINVLYPKLIGRRLQLNPLVVTIALLVWGWIWGGMGLVLAVPITAALKIICDHVDSLRPYGAWLGE
jgi:predicted PurR-regulated permease PerM